ncbi:MAG: hypothetical protein C0514_05445 [Candidatus Puniceispirillum sp.]|nr:hypothetical protein [Candidatus Puniceispirillum sp.]
MKTLVTTALLITTFLASPLYSETIEGKEVPSVADMKDAQKPYGLNLDKVGERVKVLRPLGVPDDVSYAVALYQGNLGKKNLITVTLPKLKEDLAKLGTQMQPIQDQLTALEKKRKASLLTRIKSKVSANPEVARLQAQLDVLKAAEGILNKDIAYIEVQAPLLPAITKTLEDAQGKLEKIFGLSADQVQALPPTPVKLPSGQMG